MISSITKELFRINIQPNMSEQENKRRRMICLTSKASKKLSKILEFLYGLHQAKTLKHLIKINGGV